MRIETGNANNDVTRLYAIGNPEASGKPLLLVFPWGLLSHYLRCLMLAKYFRPYFHVLFADHPAYAPYIEKEGFGTFACRHSDTGEVIEDVKKFNFSWLNEKALTPVFEDQVRVIRMLQPAAVLGDNCPTLKMAAEHTGAPYISLMNGYMSRFYAQTRSLSQSHPAKAKLASLSKTLVKLITETGESIAFYQVHKPFRKIRRQHGLSRKYFYLEELEGNWNLVCDLEALFPQKKLPPHYQVIAPLYYRSQDSAASIREKLDPAKKTIFVSMGSSGDWNKVAFLNDGHFARYNVVAAGDLKNVLHAGHMIKTDFVNVDELFPRTDLVICHGGNGTIYQSLYHGLPVLCKTAHFEQEWNTDALEWAKAGTSLDGISSLAEHIRIIETWINKDKGATAYYKKLINRQADQLPHTIRALAAKICTGVAVAIV